MSRCLARDTIFSLGGEGLYRRRIRAAKEEGVEGGELGVRKFYRTYLHESFAQGDFWLQRDLVCLGQALLGVASFTGCSAPSQREEKMLHFHKDKFLWSFRGHLREVQKEFEMSSAPEKSGVLSLIWAFLACLRTNLF